MFEDSPTALFERDGNFGEASGQRFLNRVQGNDSYFSASQVLLFRDALIGGQQYIEAGCVRSREKITVSKLVPTLSSAFNYVVTA